MLRTERDVAETLTRHAITVKDLYAACVEAGVHLRDDGEDVIHGRSDTRWKRRARNALQSLRRSGRARRTDDGTWVIAGTAEEPRSLLFILPNDLGALELHLADAHDLLVGLDDVDLVFADPPYGLNVQSGDEWEQRTAERTYERSKDLIVDGYSEAPSDLDQYLAFSEHWVKAAASAVRPGGWVVVVSGTSMAWCVGAAAHRAGLTFVSQVAVQRVFALRCTRRPAFAHWVLHLFSRGPLNTAKRYFAVSDELPRARSGATYPLDVWAGPSAPPKYERRNALRYPNALPPQLVDRVMRMTTPGPESGHAPWSALVADPFLGSGTTAAVSLARQRRFVGADVNPGSLRFTAARVLAEPPALTGGVA